LLVVDKDADAANELAEDLRSRGHAVRTAFSERQCSELVTGFRPNVVVLFMSVRGLAKELDGDVPIVNAARWKKPIDIQALLRRLREAANGDPPRRPTGKR
jgi:CheY-like chemotaxis protein